MSEEDIEIDGIDDDFIIELLKHTESHEDWLKAVRFGLATLQENQSLFAEVLVMEALRMAERDSRNSGVASDFISNILTELELEIIVT